MHRRSRTHRSRAEEASRDAREVGDDRCSRDEHGAAPRGRSDERATSRVARVVLVHGPRRIGEAKGRRARVRIEPRSSVGRYVDVRVAIRRRNGTPHAASVATHTTSVRRVAPRDRNRAYALRSDQQFSACGVDRAYRFGCKNSFHRRAWARSHDRRYGDLFAGSAGDTMRSSTTHPFCPHAERIRVTTRGNRSPLFEVWSCSARPLSPAPARRGGCARRNARRLREGLPFPRALSTGGLPAHVDPSDRDPSLLERHRIPNGQVARRISAPRRTCCRTRDARRSRPGAATHRAPVARSPRRRDATRRRPLLRRRDDPGRDRGGDRTLASNRTQAFGARARRAKGAR